MEIVGMIGIFIGIVAIIYFSVRGLNIVVAAPLAALIIILTNQMDIFSALIGDGPSYMTGLAGFFGQQLCYISFRLYFSPIHG